MLTSYWQSNFYTGIGFWQLVEPRLIQGLGISCFFTPLIAIILSDISREKMASALGLANFFRIIGGSFGTSISVSIWNDREAFHQSRLVENINEYNTFYIQFKDQLNDLGVHSMQSMGIIYRGIIQQAYMLATNDIFRLSAWIFGGLLFLVWLARPIKPNLTTKPILME